MWRVPVLFSSIHNTQYCAILPKWGGCPYLHLYQEGPLGWSTLGGLYVFAWSTLVKNQESLCGIWNQSGPRFHCTGYRYFQSVPTKVYPPNLPYFSIFTKPFPSVPSSSIVLLRNNIFAFFQFFNSFYFIPVCVRCFQHRFF
jgi:hypothetical protein